MNTTTCTTGAEKPAREMWYRYEDVSYAPSLDEYDNPSGPSVLKVHLREFPVLKHTPKGVWVNGWTGPRFVLRDARKRFACPTVDEAKASFIARKTRQAHIYDARASRARQAIRLVNGARW